MPRQGQNTCANLRNYSERGCFFHIFEIKNLTLPLFLISISNMQQYIIDSTCHPLYQKFRSLYGVSFPAFELRSESQQVSAFGNSHYRLLGFEEAGRFVGFISYWQFDGYCYVEHFAVDTALRGMGCGSRLLNAFVGGADGIVILEIDPIVDDVAEARWRFYRRCGFLQNPYCHHHPPYDKAYRPHPLVVLTSGRLLSAEEYGRFYDDLCNVVMG